MAGVAAQKQAALVWQSQQPFAQVWPERQSRVSPGVYQAGDRAIGESVHRQQQREPWEHQQRVEVASQERTEIERTVELQEPQTFEQKLRYYATNATAADIS